jgi:ANTAR domain
MELADLKRQRGNAYVLCPAVERDGERGKRRLRVPDEETAGFEVAIERLLGVAGAGIERQAQLTEALQTRIVIEQAKGVLSERFELDIDTAFDLLRGAARHDRIKIHDLAAEVVRSKSTPPSIASMLEQQRRGNVAADKV